MSRDIEVYVEHASNLMQLALARMQIEAAEFAKEKQKQLEPLLPLFVFSPDEADEEMDREYERLAKEGKRDV